MVEHLELCGNCRNVLMQEGKKVFADSTAYVRMLMQNMAKDAGVSGQLDVDIFGYTKLGAAQQGDKREARLDLRAMWSEDRESLGQMVHARASQERHQDRQPRGEPGMPLREMPCQCGWRASQNFSEGDRKIQLDDFNQKYPLQRS